MRCAVLLLAALVLAGCTGGGTETVEVTTMVQSTTTVEGPPTARTTAENEDPDDTGSALDIAFFDATRSGDLLAVSLRTRERWSSGLLAGPTPGEQGADRITILYDVDLDGSADYRGRFISAGGVLSLFISGSGSQFEPIPVERPSGTTAQFVHPVDIFFMATGGPSEGDIQLQARTVAGGEEDVAPDAGWLRVAAAP